MSRRKIKIKHLVRRRPAAPKQTSPATGIEWWRCPNCGDLRVQLRFQRPSEECPSAPPPVFVCLDCHKVWQAETGSILFGDKAERAVARIGQMQRAALERLNREAR